MKRGFMKITAIGIGTRGDVQPLVELGVEMKRRGHDYRVASFEDFKPMIIDKGLEYIHLDGKAERLTQYLITEYVKPADFLPGYRKFYEEIPRVLDQIADAVKGSDVAMYGICSFFTRSACDLYNVTAVRVFFSPFDMTNQYSLYSDRRDSIFNGLSYLSQEPAMNLLTKQLFNDWRVEHGLPRWSMFSDYRKQNGNKVLTFYPVSPYLMAPDPKWGKHIHVTGYWYQTEESVDLEAEEKLKKFLDDGDLPIFIGFGGAVSAEMKELQNRTLQAVSNMKVRTIFQGNQIDTSLIKGDCSNIYQIGKVPYDWLFNKVRAVVHHGGCTTNGLGLRAGKPTLIMPLALDQYFYGRRVHELNAGPEPIYVRFKLPSIEKIQSSIEDLISGKYDDGAKVASRVLISENGCKTAGDILENALWQ